MKTILCYGDSNTHGAAPMPDWEARRRYDIHTRWTGVMRDQLGADYWVIEEGLNGRTTVHDDPIEGIHKNGRTYLLPCLETHRPIDVVVLMLGTNDLKHRFSVTPFDVASGAEVLVDIIQRSMAGPNNTAPHVLLMCPPPFAPLTLFAQMFLGGEEKSRRLADEYRRIAQTYHCHFLNAGEVIVSSPVDGIHFDAHEHGKLGLAVAAEVRKILG
jgi:lysophospholipase L1-like esterase